MTSEDRKQHRLGLAYVALSALLWSLSGMFMLSIKTDLMTILCLRGLVSGASVMIIFAVVERGRAIRVLRQIRGPTLAAAVLAGASMICGLGAIHYASVAEAMVIYATAPFMTAGIAYLFIREKASRGTLIASFVACCGVLYMVADNVGSGGSLLGKCLAVVMALTVAGLATVMRHYRNVQMLPAMAGGSFMCSLVTVWFIHLQSITATDLWLIGLFGVVQNGCGLALYVVGARRISAASASLLTALEVPFTPLWTWIFMNDVPSRATQIGGAIVLLALFGHILIEIRGTRAPVLNAA
ncbi:MAG TPA: DMT family transporter [Dongiaceae bacterium]|nr:DMT family transporter [Dongiaceae bacterium]